MRKARLSPLVPVILAAGRAPQLPFPLPLARFGKRTALSIALRNCRAAGFDAPIVVLGANAARVRPAVPSATRIVVNRRWRAGMLGSIRAALRRVPRRAAILLYPVDLPMLTPQILRSLAAAWGGRDRGIAIVSPIHRGRAGHPVILAPELRGELFHARTARDLVERAPRRVAHVPVPSAAIYQDFATPAEYRRCLRLFRRSRHA